MIILQSKYLLNSFLQEQLLSMRIFVFIFISFYFHNTACFSQFKWTPNCSAAFSSLFSADISTCLLQIENEKKKNPENQLPFYLDAYTAFFEYLLCQSDDQSRKYFQKIDKNLKQISNSDKKAEGFHYYRAEIRFHSAIVNFLNGSYISSLDAMLTSYNLLTESQKEHPNFIQNLKLQSIFSLIFQYAGDEFSWLKTAMPDYKNQVIGFQLFDLYQKKVAQQTQIKEEIFILNVLLHFYLDSDELQAFHLSSGNQSTQVSVVMKLVNIVVCLKANKNEQALQILEKIGQDERKKIPFFDYFEGAARLNKLDKNALTFFERFLRNYAGSNCKKSAWQKILWHKMIFTDAVQAELYRQEILSKGKTDIELDKSAQNEIIRSKKYNLQLLRSRLLFDGGYYAEALNILRNEIDFQKLENQSDGIEFLYRSGRIHQKLGNTDLALRYFGLCAEAGKNSNLSYSSNACMNIAKIYSEQLLYCKANQYYKAAMEHNKLSNSRSINLKAKAEIKKLKKYACP